MSRFKLQRIDRLKRQSPDAALKKLNQLTGLAWNAFPVSLVNSGNHKEAKKAR